MQEKYAAVDSELKRLESTHTPPSEALNAMLASRGTAGVSTGVSLADLIRRPQVSYADTAPFDPAREASESRDGAGGDTPEVRRLHKAPAQARWRSSPAWRERRLPDIDYDDVPGLRIEAREKLEKIRPVSFGQARRISGVSPADISVLMVYVESGGEDRAG